MKPCINRDTAKSSYDAFAGENYKTHRFDCVGLQLILCTLGAKHPDWQHFKETNTIKNNRSAWKGRSTEEQ